MNKNVGKYSIKFMSEQLNVSREGYYKWVESKEKPYKYEELLAEMKEIISEDEENENYGSERMYYALKTRYEEKDGRVPPCQSTIARIMRENGLIHKKKRKPKSITKADKEAQKSDDLLKRNFTAERPNEKWVTDITEMTAKDGKLYLSGIFDCYDNSLIALSMDDNMCKELVIDTVKQAMTHNKEARGVILHSDRGGQYTSDDYRKIIGKFGINQSMNSASGRCHDNAKCESMWGRFKEEKIYKIDVSKITVEELKDLIFRYFMSYWNNRRICTANGGMPPAVKRNLYFSQSDKEN